MQVTNKHADGFVKFAQKYVNHKQDTIQAEISARRVAVAGAPDHIEISMAVTQCFAVSNLHRNMTSRIELTPEEASALIAALAKPWNQQQETQKELL